MYDSVLGGGRRRRDDGGVFIFAEWLCCDFVTLNWIVQFETVAKNSIFVFYDVVHNIAVDCHCVK